MYKIIGADQKEYGPVSLDQLRQWISEGRVNAQTRVQAVGATDWQTIGSLPEFASIFPPAAPTAPPLPPSAIHLPATQRRTSQMAIWSLVTGIIALLCCQVYLAPVSIVLGAVALGRLKRHPEETGSGMAIAGIVLGSLAVLMGILIALVMISRPEVFQNLQSQMQSSS